MAYYIAYEDYTDLTQFEGSWDWRFEEHDSLTEAQDRIKALKASSNDRNVNGPLIEPCIVRSTKPEDCPYCGLKVDLNQEDDDER